MKTYTLDEVIEKKIIVIVDNQEQFDLIRSAVQVPRSSYNSYYPCIRLFKDNVHGFFDTYGVSSLNYYRDKFGYEHIYFSQITDFKDSLIGYKLKSEFEDQSGVLDLITKHQSVTYANVKETQGYYCIKNNAESITRFTELNLLNLWFEPVYDNSVTIAGYKSQKKEDGIYFGCKSFTKDELHAIKKLLSITEVDVSLTIQNQVITKDLISTILTN